MPKWTELTGYLEAPPVSGDLLMFESGNGEPRAADPLELSELGFKDDAGQTAGIIAIAAVARGDCITVIGVDASGADADVANKPVMLWGTTAFIQGQLALQVPDGALDADYENHLMAMGPIIVSGGRSYTTMRKGPKIAYAVTEVFPEDANDFDLTQDAAQIVPAASWTVAGTFTDVAELQWQMNCVNLATKQNEAAEISIQPRVNGAPVGAPTEFTLAGPGQQFSTGAVQVPTPQVGDTADLEVTSSNWGHNANSDPRVEGSTGLATKIALRQPN